MTEAIKLSALLFDYLINEINFVTTKWT